jgi:drug/metabolite transporter (DMT)-like permease
MYNKLPLHTQAISWKLANCLIFTLISVVARITQISMPLFASYWLSVVLAVALLAIVQLHKLRWHNIFNPLYSLQALIGVAAMSAWFYSLQTIAIAEATAIGYLTPILTILLAIIVLKERWHYKLIIGFVLAFGGAYLTLSHTAFSDIKIGSYLAAASALLWALHDIIIKRFNSNDSYPRRIFYVLIWYAIFLSPLAWYNWQTPEPLEFFGCSLLGMLFIINLWALYQAYAKANLVLLMPFSFSRLVFAAIFGYILFSEQITINVWFGSILIIYGSYHSVLHLVAYNKNNLTYT